MEIQALAALEKEVEVNRLTPEEVREWRYHPATRAFLMDLRMRQFEGMETWLRRGYEREGAVETALANAKALGGAELLQTLIDFLEGKEA